MCESGGEDWKRLTGNREGYPEAILQWLITGNGLGNTRHVRATLVTTSETTDCLTNFLDSCLGQTESKGSLGV